MVCCWAVGCTNRTEKGFQLFCFPTEKTIRDIWVKNVNRSDPTNKNPRSIKLLEPKNSSRLCEAHFEQDCFLTNAQTGKKNLKKGSFPTIFLHVEAKPKRARTCRTRPTEEGPSTGELSLDSGAEDKRVYSLKQTVAREVRRRRKAERDLCMLKRNIRQMLNEDQQTALSRKSTRGLKWSAATVKKGLKLRFSCGDTGYKELLKLGRLPLPSVRTLQIRLQKIAFKPGLLESVFHYLQTKVISFCPGDRLCCLTLDEMQISSRVEYDVSSSSVLGDVTIPGNSGAANHALVFMLGGICQRWKQTVAYHFTGDAIKGHALKSIIDSIITRATDIGLRVVAVTSDMGASNRAMWKDYQIICNRTSLRYCAPHPTIADQSIVFLADPPHVVKNLRAAFVKHKCFTLPEDICTTYSLASNTVALAHINDLIDFQSADAPLAPKLTKKDIEPTHFQKMNVGSAMHVFSNSTSAGLRYLVARENRSKDYLTTAWFIETINHWFDLMNSRHPVLALSKAKEEKYVAATSFLKMVITLFSGIGIGANREWKPVQTGVILSTTSVLALANDILQDQNFLLTSRLTQDCLENLFSVVRSRNPTPTPREFKFALKSITVAQYLKPSKTSNYEHDEREYLGDLLPATVTPPQPEPEYAQIEQIHPITLSERDVLTPDEEASLYYLTGYCIQSLKKLNQFCDNCLEWSKNDTEHPHSILVLLKNYKDGALFQASDAIFQLVKLWEVILRKLEPELRRPNVKEYFVRQCEQTVVVDFTPPPPSCHPLLSRLLNKFVQVRLHFMCRKMNQVRKSRSIPLGSRSAARQHVTENL